ncbi:hypothetical protein EYF80_033589 [Liparis tanakae]|uniref:Uncharacterized protein n=1 Tax=Liparis tanakae TaxID=230148 RepID=A0A4Z2GTY9_9TELE|nr:hypothetical protein EYF80_033589 [Liparis tanakae]
MSRLHRGAQGSLRPAAGRRRGPRPLQSQLESRTSGTGFRKIPPLAACRVAVLCYVRLQRTINRRHRRCDRNKVPHDPDGTSTADAERLLEAALGTRVTTSSAATILKQYITDPGCETYWWSSGGT